MYAHELNCPAYRCLSPDARALLVEFRALYNGGKNLVFLSVREMMSRVGIGQRRAQAARDELLACGWIRMQTPGGFSRKVKHATEFVLTNEPLDERDGAVAPKDFMRWKPEPKITVAAAATLGSQDEYRTSSEIEQMRVLGSHHGYRTPPFQKSAVAEAAAQILIPRECSERDSLIWAAMACPMADSTQFGLVAAGLVMLWYREHEQMRTAA
ncbi:MAG: helix-turn-helix domain-containing protein [Nevskia sp.]|nr:helix-turn-helix domain-containing protein [Nevskia sp.]